ncbi:hypothetical protein ACI2LF_43775 [Kribbella sp. NPDC020789]
MAKGGKKNRRFRGEGKGRPRKAVMNTEDAMTKMVTNRRSKSSTWASRVRDLVKAHGKDGAKDRLGVSDSTMRAWLKGRRAPNKANAATILGEHDTSDVRRSQVSRYRQRQLDRMASDGARLVFRASVGPRDEAYKRFRRISRDLPAEVAERINDAFINGGPDAARAELIEVMREYFQDYTDPSQPDYDPSMEIYLDDITDISLKPR